MFPCQLYNRAVKGKSHSVVSFLFSDVLGYITKYTSATAITPKGKEKASILREVFIKGHEVCKHKDHNCPSTAHRIILPNIKIMVNSACAVTTS
jgi:hypothetical protein